MSTQERPVADTVELEAALDEARALAGAIRDSSSFLAYTAARERLDSDQDVNRRLQAFQHRQQELLRARAWGGADVLEEERLVDEWRRISAMPTLAAFLRSQESLKGLLQDVASFVSEEIGVDYGVACAPSGGCCG